MANLVSPGVSISIIDESQYVGAGPGTVPFIMIATGQDKLNSAGDGTALGTTKAQAGKLQLVTSQRELIQQFGLPNFNNIGGSSQHGYELNEYGLLAAHSYLGNANRAFIMRADIDLNQLQPLDNAPVGAPNDGTYWFDTATSNFGIYINDGTNWVKHNPIIIEDPSLLESNGAPDPSQLQGENFGDFAVVVGKVSVDSTTTYENKYYRWSSDFAWASAENYTNEFFVTSVYPTNKLQGDGWVNLNEIDYVVKLYDGAWFEQDAPFFSDDAAATAFYGTQLTEGNLYVRWTEPYLGTVPSAEEFLIKRYTSGAWTTLSYEASSTAPSSAPAEGTLWYSNNIVVDILYNDGEGNWFEVTENNTIFTQPSEPANPVDGDIWVDTDQLDEYPVIYKLVNDDWVLVNNTDQTTPSGIIFADARPLPSDELDADAPDPLLYPAGMLLWNTRYSSLNVKEWRVNYTVDGQLIGDRWVSVSGNAQDGSLLTGRKAQRSLIVEAMASAMLSNEDIKAESVIFNLMAAPGYIELVDEMISLNVDRKEKAFIIGDAPLRLQSSGTAIQAWATNSNDASQNGETGLIAADPYLGIYYPGCLTTNLDGEAVVQPASHMILRTMAYNDQVSYPWFAPAGIQRGRVNNAESVGYINAEDEFVTVELNEGQRDVLYTNKINPIAQIPGQGLIVYGQKTRNPAESALDRVNVARLVNYIRYQAEQLARPFLFEPNDQLTRNNVRDAYDRLLSELVTLRGLDDFLVVVDESNNTPARIDRNELWIDIAIVPVKAIEFIYIPIRIKNSGEI
jgi:hypothetical protein